ncbi:MAG: hypothetical protein DDT31_01645 [Syntrophomonadaceae bacterium]|nr:hypothetical protein [Bacillota bacterium]
MGFCIDNLADPALIQYGIAFDIEACVEEYIFNIPKPALFFINEIFALS